MEIENYEKDERHAIQEEGCTAEELAAMPHRAMERFKLSSKVREELEGLYRKIDALRASGRARQYTMGL